MDTLSTSISTFTNIPKSHLKNQLLHHHRHHHHHPSASTTKRQTTKISNKSTTLSTQNHLLPPHVNSSRSSSEPQQRPSTGYAVALLDAARRHNAVDAVRRDVRRLSRWLRDDQLRHAMADPFTDKAAIVKEGRFQKHLGKLVKLLAEKGKLELLGQVLSEFGRIYDDLSLSVSNHQLLLLPRGLKIHQNQILEIVGRIQRVTGEDKLTLIHPTFV